VSDNTRFLQDSFTSVAEMVTAYEEVATEADGGPVSADAIGRAKAARSSADWAYLQAEVPKALEQMQDGLARVAKIVGAMKEFAHVDQSTEMAGADINRSLESTLVVARNEYKYVARAETEFGELPAVMCHIGDLNQVFLNLVINAAHAIEDRVGEGQDLGCIGVRTMRDGDWVEISISDTGTGIAPEIRDKVFDPFFTTKVVGRGSGQGLALAHAIVVEKHGGTLTFETEVGQGTTFHVRLPVNGKRGTIPALAA
jgi:signal transduction histidine kinase